MSVRNRRGTTDNVGNLVGTVADGQERTAQQDAELARGNLPKPLAWRCTTNADGTCQLDIVNRLTGAVLFSAQG